MPYSFYPPDIQPLRVPFPIRFIRACLLFLTGGLLYFAIEILWRGYSHFSMFLCGGLCFTGIYLINRICHRTMCIVRWIYGAVWITVIEFWCGITVNLIFGWNVWDYTALPWNLLGQVCLPFTLLWFCLCIPADWLCMLFRRLFHVEFARKY